ncbi:lipopolysaccharide transport periplasmic protein LptA [Legionella dresdenensis]|uniref:Lipopolysaccharide transport periplasmic protein LptA n=1 Tax=Legionella dresdenensis TaxID=450200 RepID=A0ABV8CCJ0_9GAMM
MILNTRRLLAIAILQIVFGNLAHALPEDRQQIAQLSADNADLNQQLHQGEYTGNVQFDQGTTHLRAEKAITKGNEQNKLTYAVAYGNKENPAHFWTKTAADKPELHAYAQEIKYYPEKNLVELVGDARVIQGENSFSAPKISYNTLKQHIVSESSATARTVIIFHPEKKI